MALSSALFTGLSGLDVNQTKLNVVGNNIANANTTGFKSSRTLFKPQFYVTDEAGSAPDGDFGGTNPSQRGLGATVASIEKDFTTGQIETTGKASDMAIDGDGFFVVQGKQQQFTRDGSFTLNDNSQLVTTTGEKVQGYKSDADGNILTGSLTDITIPLGQETNARATKSVSFEGNLNSDGVVSTGASILNSQALTDFGTGSAAAPSSASLLTDLRNPADTATPLMAAGDKITITGKRGGRDESPMTYTVGATDTLADFSDFVNQAMGIDTSVTPPAGSPTPGVSIGAVAGDAANTGHIIISGNTGTENALALTGTAITSSSGTSPFSFGEGEDTAGIKSDPTGESVSTSYVAYDSLGTPLTVNVTATLESKSDTGNTWRFYATSPNDTDASSFTAGSQGQKLGTGTLTFDSNGKLVSSTGTTLSIDRKNTGALSPLTMSLDTSKVTSLADRSSDLVVTKQDGSSIGTLTSFSIGANGTISGSFSNGLSRNLGRVALANFKNPEGLVDTGGNMYSTGPGSGLPIVSSPTELGSGEIRSGALESSNVDLSKEFVNLIVASTGFSASSRVITTSDQLLTELLNTSR